MFIPVVVDRVFLGVETLEGTCVVNKIFKKMRKKVKQLYMFLCWEFLVKDCFWYLTLGGIYW
jgi:hypothetical protein